MIAVVVLAARRHAAAGSPLTDVGLTSETKLCMARLWVALLVLGQLRSPFLPGTYGNTAIIILLALHLPLTGMRILRMALVALGVIVFAMILPLPVGPTSSTLDYAFGIFATLFAAGFAMETALRRPPDPLGHRHLGGEAHVGI